MFGKVPFERRWASCCVVVANLQRSVLVVPDSSVFSDADGETARLDAQFAADPATKGQLIRHLQVGLNKHYC